jgi:hypothetical protein
MEWWNSGILGIKTEIILILTSDLENGSKKDLILMNPLFQSSLRSRRYFGGVGHSSIPSPHDICIRHSQLPLTWPRGPGFLCLIKTLDPIACKESLGCKQRGINGRLIFVPRDGELNIYPPIGGIHHARLVRGLNPAYFFLTKFTDCIGS